MVQENSRVTGRNGKRYTLGKEVGAGGEGRVFLIAGANLVGKIYKSPDPKTEEKIRYMVSHPIQNLRDTAQQPLLSLAWPQDILCDDSGAFIGYTMPFIGNGVEICTIAQGCNLPKAQTMFPNYNWLFNLRVAINLARSVDYLHRNHCVVGDLNCKNIMVAPDGSITMLDNDSFDMVDSVSGIHYRCCAGTQDYLAPELQGRDLRQPTAAFTKESDNFALAVHIFQLMMNNFHPFTGKNMVVIKNSTSINQRLDHLINGKCPFIHDYPDLAIPVGAPHLQEMVTEQLIQDFVKTFDYNANNINQRKGQRTTAAQWAADLEDYWNRFCAPGAAHQCRSNSQHFYLKSMGKCGLCAAKQRLSDFRKKMANQAPARPTAAATSPKPAAAAAPARTTAAPSPANPPSASGAQNTNPPSKKSSAWWFLALIVLAIVVISNMNKSESSKTTSPTSTTAPSYSDNYLQNIEGVFEDLTLDGVECGMLHLDTPIRGMKSMNIEMKVTEWNGQTCNTWMCLGWIDGQWEWLGEVYISGVGYSNYKSFTGDGTKWIEYIAMVPMTDQAYSGSFELAISSAWQSGKASPGTRPSSIGQISQNSQSSGYFSQLSGSWEETSIEGQSCSMLHLEVPIRGMKQMTFNFDVDMRYGAKCKEWKCFAWIDGAWKKLGTLNLPSGNGSGTATFYGDGSDRIEYIAIRPTASGSYSFEFRLWLTDVYENG